jgi:hypothetical protein
MKLAALQAGVAELRSQWLAGDEQGVIAQLAPVTEDTMLLAHALAARLSQAEGPSVALRLVAGIRQHRQDIAKPPSM